MRIRRFAERDWPQLWPIVHNIVQAQETFAYDPAMTSAEAHDIWIEPPPGLTVIAEDDDRIIGTAKMGANRVGPGAHVSTASFMVAQDAQGRGVGTALLCFALAWAREQGFAGMQFNAVVASNSAAIKLYERHGFGIVGTVPGAFMHPQLGRVGLLVMYREL